MRDTLTLQTIIDEDKIEEWCLRLPDCRQFLENFFLTCSQYDIKTNYLNYASDIISQQGIDPIWHKYGETLMHAFEEITTSIKRVN
ncbi:MAG: hypothetical protein V1729_00405 [Candidatus Woesearchaeota archaeon]